MKYIEKKYQQLIEEIKSAYDDTTRAYEDTCDTLKYHINELKEQLANKDEEIEKLKGGSQLQKEIDEYNRFEAQNNMNLEDEITQLRIKLTEKESELKEAGHTIEAWENRFYTLVKAYDINLDKLVKTSAVVHHCGEGEPKVYKPKTRKRSKNILVSCKDCGTYFQAKSKNAKYCTACGQKRAKASRAKWLAKQAKKK